MSGFFQVDLEALQRFVTSLRQSRDRMEFALNSMKAADGERIGTKELDDAASHFQDKWRYGLGQLKDRISNTNDGVSAAQRAYQELDKQIEDPFRKITEAISGGK